MQGPLVNVHFVYLPYIARLKAIKILRDLVVAQCRNLI